MSILEIEGSPEHSAPREGIEIMHGNVVYRISTGTRDVDINGNTFFATPADREELSDFIIKQDRDTSIRLPTSHPFVQRYNRNGFPPQVITCAIYRKQGVEVERIAFGEIQSCKIDGHVASFLLIEQASRALKRSLPIYPVGKQCPYVVFDLACRAARALNSVSTTVVSHDGAQVVVAAMDGHPDQWARRGKFWHIPSGERLTVSSQVGTTITLQFPLFEIADGDLVEIDAGCENTPIDCRDKFNNLVNYGGAPLLPEGDVYMPNGYGQYQSEPDA